MERATARRLLFTIPIALVGVCVFFFKHQSTTDAPKVTTEITTPVSPSMTSPIPLDSNPTESADKSKSAYRLWREVEFVDKTRTDRFHKVDMQGQILPSNASVWECVYDEATGLLWEVKTNDGGWQDHSHTYSWYEPPEEVPASGVQHGVADSGQCYDIACDTTRYKMAVNQQALCSVSLWRLPYAHELGFLDHPENYYPDIDTDYFPNTAIAYYWSRTEALKVATLAWAVDFNNGFPYISEKRMAYRVRLVSDALWLADQLAEPSVSHPP